MSKKPDPRLEMKHLLESRFEPKQLQQDYENRVIAHILKRCGQKQLIKPLQRQYHEQYGTYVVSMEYFLTRFEDFPVHLIADSMQGIKLHRDRTASFARTIIAFEETPFAKCYRRYAKNYDGEKSLVVVFPRDLVQLGLVIHSGLLNVQERVGTQIRFRNARGEGLYVESFANVLSAIYDNGDGWCPRLR